MSIKNIIYGAGLSSGFSLMGLMLIAIVYGFAGRKPDAIEISLVTWSVTFFSCTMGFLFSAAED